MARHLVIVESPAKAKTINKYLGKDYLVKSSIGHIRDLPSGASEEAGDPLEKARAAQAALRAKGRVRLTEREKAKNRRAALIRRMGVDPDHGWAARYEIVPGKEKTVAELKAAAEKADTIYLASDLDREGEAIAWHLQELIGGDPARFRRVTFAEITKPAIAAAFAAPGAVDMARVNAQQARRFLDRVVGFEVSPLLWSKVARGLSAGRVQSVAVRLIVEREREISAFVPEEYWEIHADLSAGADRLRAQITAKDGAAFAKRRLSRAEADAAQAPLAAATWRVAEVESKQARDWPNPPFKTSTLQAAASIRLGFSVKKTMTLAQRLYEAGHITYMRTDSLNLGADALAAVRALIAARFGERSLPEKPVHYKSGANAQEAHEAIRPTDLGASAEQLDAEPDARRLYDLIWRQTVASQMTPAEYDTATATIAAGAYTAVASGRVLRFPGWHAVMPPAKREDQPLPTLAAGQALRLDRLDPSRHFTTPPPRWSEASLVKELEKRGIGRPSTYAAIISTIQERGYVRLDTRRFHAEKLGEIVTGRLLQAFPDLMDYEFTRGLEADLDAIADGGKDWIATLDAFYAGFSGKLGEASERMQPAALHPAGIACPDCARPMVVRTGSTGVFLSCSGYGLPPKERCTRTLNLVRGDEAEAVADARRRAERADADAGDEDVGDEADALALNARRRCTVCGSAMDAFLVDESRRLHICGRNPDCAGIQVEPGAFKLKGYDGPSIPCDKCGKPMQLKTGRFGKYFGCTGYPVCVNTRKLLRSGEAAPPKSKPVPMPELACTKGGHFVLRDGAAGVFLASNLYPKVRETRNPTVAELRAHRAELDPKHQYLADGPDTGRDGQPTVIRFARQGRTQYIASADGAQAWHYDQGRWIERQGAAEEKPPRKRRG